MSKTARGGKPVAEGDCDWLGVGVSLAVIDAVTLCVWDWLAVRVSVCDCVCVREEVCDWELVCDWLAVSVCDWLAEMD